MGRRSKSPDRYRRRRLRSSSSSKRSYSARRSRRSRSRTKQPRNEGRRSRSTENGNRSRATKPRSGRSRSNRSRAVKDSQGRNDSKSMMRKQVQLSSSTKLSGRDSNVGASQSENAGTTKELEKPKEKPDFGVSGALLEDEETGNVKNGVVLKWAPPDDSTNPDKKWRIYLFRHGKIAETLHIHRQPSYLIGRDNRISEIVLRDPSCSKQHAVIQFRTKKLASPPGSMEAPRVVVRPYVMDLQSTNGTFLNGKQMDHSRYVELLDKDMLTFGTGSDQYILMSPDALND